MTVLIRRNARSRVLLTALVAAGIGMSGCSTSTQSSTAITTASATEVTGTSSASDSVNGSNSSAASTGQFPVTVNSLYGDLTFQEQPTRIVALTYQIADILTSLGVQPIAVAMSQEDIPLSRPWLEGQLTGTLDPGLISTDDAVNVEKVLSYEPDLVIGDSWQIADQSVYDTLSVVAPTYAGTEKGNVDWDQQTIALAKIIGQPDRASTVIAEVDKMFEASRSKLAALEGKTYHYARFATTEGFAFGNGSWLEQFGLVPAATQDNLMQGAGVSLENLDQMNADVLAIWAYDGEQPLLEADPRFAALPSTKAGTTIWADLKLAYATNGPGPLSLAYANDVVTPILLAAGSSNG